MTGRPTGAGFTPVYWLPIGVVWRVVGNWQLAARLVPLWALLLLIPTVFCIGRRLHSAASGLFAAAVVPFLPLVLHYSYQARREPLFMLFFTLSALMFLIAFERKAWWWYGMLGLTAALAFMVRPEGLAVVGVSLGLLVILRSPSGDYGWKRRALHGAVLVLGFGLFNAPYWNYLHRRTGNWHLTGQMMEAKVPGPKQRPDTAGREEAQKGIEADAGNRENPGSPQQAAQERSRQKNVEEETSQQREHKASGTASTNRTLTVPAPLRRLGRYLDNLRKVFVFTLARLIPLILLILIPLGFVAGTGGRKACSGRLIAAAMILPALVLLPVLTYGAPYFVGYVPVLVVFAAGGAESFLRAAAGAVSAVRWIGEWRRTRRVAEVFVIGGLLGLLVVPVAHGVYGEFAEREAGGGKREAQRGKRKAATTDQTQEVDEIEQRTDR
jgi:hypothetical protein